MYNLDVLALFQAGALVLSATYLVQGARGGRKPQDDLLVLFWLASLLPVAGLAKTGASHNYWFELAAISSVLATAATWNGVRRLTMREGRIRSMSLPLILFGANVFCVAAFVYSSALAGLGTYLSGSGRAQDLAGIIQRVRTEPAEVLAQPLDVVVLAGRPVLLEPYIFSILQRGGQWDADPLVRRICAREISLLVLGMPLEDAGFVHHGYPHWPDPVLAALRATMVLESEQAGRFLYVATLASSPRACESKAASASWPAD
jgi:hypothetical protein